MWGQEVPEVLQKPSNFLLKFGTKEEIAEKEEELSEEDSRRYAEQQKGIWLGIFGMDKDGNKIEPDSPLKTRLPPSMVKEFDAGPSPPGVAPVAPPTVVPPAPPAPRRKVKVYSANGH